LNSFFIPLMTQASFLIHPGERSRFIRSTLKRLCREPRFRHQWRPADHLATLCHIWFTIPEPLQFNGNDLNNALLKDPALKLDIQVDKSAPNQFGIYHNTYWPSDANRKIHFYYLCEHTFLPITRSDKNNSPHHQRPIWTALPLQ
jgi:hypothetical protein